MGCGRSTAEHSGVSPVGGDGGGARTLRLVTATPGAAQRTLTREPEACRRSCRAAVKTALASLDCAPSMRGGPSVSRRQGGRARKSTQPRRGTDTRDAEVVRVGRERRAPRRSSQASRRLRPHLMVPLPAAPAEQCAGAVAAEVAAVLAEVLGLQRRGRHAPEAAGLVDDAGLALAGRGHGEEGEELFGEKEVGEMIGLHLGVVSCQHIFQIQNI